MYLFNYWDIKKKLYLLGEKRVWALISGPWFWWASKLWLSISLESHPLEPTCPFLSPLFSLFNSKSVGKIPSAPQNDIILCPFMCGFLVISRFIFPLKIWEIYFFFVHLVFYNIQSFYFILFYLFIYIFRVVYFFTFVLSMDSFLFIYFLSLKF